MDKLIITCCVGSPLATARELADMACAVRDAGAAVAHLHKPFVGKEKMNSPFPVEAWQEVGNLIAEEGDVIFQHGLGGFPYLSFEHRIPPFEKQLETFDLKAEKCEMISFLLGAIDHDFGEPHRPNSYTMPTRDEIAKYLQLCRAHGVKPEFEVWHTGNYWNLQWAIERKVVDPPYWLTLFFAGSGGVWSPPTVEELQHRLKGMPQPALWEVSVRCRDGGHGSANTQEQLTLLVEAILLGGHVRVGLEDNPFLWDGIPAKNNIELVERMVRIARELGREIATPDEARQMMGLPPRNTVRRKSK